jgi:hypothetical protein
MVTSPRTEWRNCTLEISFRLKKEPLPHGREEPEEELGGQKCPPHTSWLEGELDGQLDATRAAAAQEWVADTHVAGGGEVIAGVCGEI